MGTVKQLPTVKFGKTWYFVDTRLQEYRAVNNPHLRFAFNEEKGVEICNECGQSVRLGSGRFVNRVSDGNDESTRREMGKPFPHGDWMCAECDEHCPCEGE